MSDTSTSRAAREHARGAFKAVAAAGGALTKTVAALWPYLWPQDRADLKARVVATSALIVLAKLATMAVP
ncbi:MAG: hypothetical protein B7Y61_23135, partial [Rhizobiales bacterium 35-66-30]